MENKEVRRGHNHNQWKRRIVAGHVGVVDYISSQILTKVSCSLALPTPDDPFACMNSLELLFYSAQVSLSRRKI